MRDALPKKRKLTAAEVSELNREHTTTIEPARHHRNEILALERKLSDLVNAAYGLSPKEVELLWATAPPRTPLGTDADPTMLRQGAEDPDDD